MLLGAVLLAGAAACGSSGGGKAAGPAVIGETTTAAPTVSTVAPDSPQAGVVLDDPGAAPGQVLVLRVAKGTTVSSALVSKIGLQLSVGGKPLPATVVPGTRMVMTQRVDRVDGDGTVHYSVTITDASVVDTPGADASVVSQTQAGLAQLKGLSGTGSLDAHGGHVSASFDTRALANSTLKSTLDSFASQVGNLTAPFPAEPVGPGARWTATRSASINGITMNTTSRYTLRSRTGDHYELDVSTDAVAPPGAAPIPNLPAGTTASVTNFAIHSSGRVAGELTQAVPTNSTVSGTGDGAFTIAQGKDSASATEHLTMEFVLSPA